MRFVCDSCRAQYMISDEKVGPRGVKVRCKKCGHVIHVRRENEAQGAPAAAPAPPESEAPAAAQETATGENNIFSGVDEDEIGAAFDQALGGEGMKVTNPFQPAEDDSTRVMDEESVKRFAEMSQGATPTPVPPPAAPYEWFVAVNEVQTGPLSESKVKELWDRGEIGPDCLTWRQGLSDWIPLSDVRELAALLAPRPSRPLFAAAPTPVPPSVMTVPVESAFSAGGMTRTVRSEIPVATSDTGFRPSATAALASLVKDEIEALNKPPPSKEPPAPAPRSILEVPEEPVKRSGPSATAMPAVRPGPNGAPTVPTPFAYRPATASVPVARKVKGITIGLAALGVAVAVLAVGVGFLIVQGLRKPEPVAVAVLPPPPVAPLPVAPPTPPPSSTLPAASATPPPSTAKTPPTPPGLARAPVPVPAVEPPQRRGTGTSHRTGSAKASGGGTDSQLEGPVKDTIEASRPRNKADDLFDEVFGTPDGKKAAPAGDKGKKTAYVPPAPGVSDVPEKVGDGDIMSVVLANKSSMVRCVDEQKSRDTNLHGTLVMHWVIQTSGRTTNVSPVTEAYRSSYFATCMTGLIKTWQFPKHRFSPGQAVDFPFKF